MSGRVVTKANLSHVDGGVRCSLVNCSTVATTELFNSHFRIFAVPLIKSGAVTEASVEVTELMGAEIYLYLVTTGLEDEEQNLIARVSPRSEVRAGDAVKIAVDLSRVHVFDKDTERCIAH